MTTVHMMLVNLAAVIIGTVIMAAAAMSHKLTGTSEVKGDVAIGIARKFTARNNNAICGLSTPRGVNR